ncbi:hypothetical protein [Amycolatopsis minnesotensis]|uniref:Uncharacterized protein n=1 Tax=Amycolatopsis minnesotensis TaxID=337894 RepID=A0ABN2RQZ6_9PSEU
MTMGSGRAWRRLDAAVLTQLEPDVAAIAGAAIEQVHAGLRQPLDEATAANLQVTVNAALTAFFAEIGHPEAAADRELFGGTVDDPAGRLALALALRIQPHVAPSDAEGSSKKPLRSD